MLTFNYGVMNSAKSVNLICKAYELKQKNLKYICVYPEIDNRTEDGFITSRAGLKIEAKKIKNGFYLYKELRKIIDEGYKYILVDEVQFLDERCVNMFLHVSEKHNINILCYGLLTDFQTHLFPASKRLVEIADKLHNIESYCECGNKASINARINKEGKLVTEGDQFLIGSEDKYKTLCKGCYLKELESKHGKVNASRIEYNKGDVLIHAKDYEEFEVQKVYEEHLKIVSRDNKRKSKIYNIDYINQNFILKCF